MADREQHGSDSGGREAQTALVLVSNAVTGDSRVLRTARTLRELGLEVLIAGVVTDEQPLVETRIDGFRVIRLPRLELHRRRRRERREADAAGAGADSATTGSVARPKPLKRALGRHLARLAYYGQGVALVRRTSPVLVHANDYSTMWIGVAAKLLRRSRLVYDAHELWADRNYYRREWRPWLLACEWLFVRLADATITVSPGIADTMARRYRVAPPVVVRNVSDSVVRSAPAAEGLRAAAGPLAVYVGGLTSGRGIEQAIEALAAAPEFRLRLMGPASLGFEAGLAQRAAEAGVADRVEIRAAVEPTAVAEAIAGADLGLALIQPICLSYELSLPTKLFEYVAAGLPVVASDLPVLGALVRHEGIGEAVAPTDAEAIAQAMRMVVSPERNAELRERVRAFAERTTWAQEQRTLEGIYLSLVPRGRGGRG